MKRTILAIVIVLLLTGIAFAQNTVTRHVKFGDIFTATPDTVDVNVYEQGNPTPVFTATAIPGTQTELAVELEQGVTYYADVTGHKGTETATCTTPVYTPFGCKGEPTIGQ